MFSGEDAGGREADQRGRRVDGGVAHASGLVDKDVRRFFQSPVDAAPGNVDAYVSGPLIWTAARIVSPAGRPAR